MQSDAKMKSGRACFGSTLWIAAVIALAAAGAAGDEIEPFLAAHKKAEVLAASKNWSGAAKVYGAFAAERRGGQYAPLASLLQGIILRREMERTDEARAALERAAKAGDTPLGREFVFAALAWSARFQMAQIDKALHKYYVDEVEYPRNLKELVERKLLAKEKSVDPWGNRFSYRATRRSITPDVPRQVYTLKCTSIRGHSHQLARILKESVELQRRYRLRGVTGSERITAVLARSDKSGKRVKVTEGDKVGSAKAIRVTRRAVILMDDGIVAVVTQ